MAFTADYNTNLLSYPTLENRQWDPAGLLALEDQAGIDKAVIFPECTVQPDNAGLAAAIAGNDRFIGGAIINPSFGAASVVELERCVREFGIKTLKFQPTFHGFLVHGPVVDPLMRKVRECGLVLTAHSGSWNANPLQIAALAKRYPEVQIIMEHAGYRWYLGDALAAAEQAPNISLGLSIIATETVMIQQIYQAVGPERMVWGSDAPSAYPDLAAEAVRRQRFGHHAEQLIFGGNLARIYKL